MSTTSTERAAAEMRAELARQQMTVSDLALKLGKPKASVARRLNGTQPLTVDDLFSIATVLGVHPSQFLPDVAAVA